MSALATRLKESLQLVDSAVFPENPFQVFIFNRRPDFQQPQFGLLRHKDDFNRSSYCIFSQGIEEYFDVTKARRDEAIILAKKFNFHAKFKSDNLVLQEAVPYDEQKECLFAAIHEVRHRVQFFRMSAELLCEKHTRIVERCRFWGEIQSKHYALNRDEALEFDAKFIEHYVATEMLLGRFQPTPEQLAQFLLLTPRVFFEKEKAGR